MVKISKKYKLNKVDGTKLLKGLGIALGGAFLTYAAEMIPMVDFGIYTPLAVAFGAALINAGRKLLAGK